MDNDNRDILDVLGVICLFLLIAFAVFTTSSADNTVQKDFEVNNLRTVEQ